jgi:hypothetical protein
MRSIHFPFIHRKCGPSHSTLTRIEEQYVMKVMLQYTLIEPRVYSDERCGKVKNNDSFRPPP